MQQAGLRLGSFSAAQPLLHPRASKHPHDSAWRGHGQPFILTKCYCQVQTLPVAQSSKVIKCNSIYSMLLAVLLGCVAALPLAMLCPFTALPCPCPAIHVLFACSALPDTCPPCPALPCPALCDGLVTFGATVTGVCTALRPVKGGKQKRMCVTPLQHSLRCFSCCQDLMASGKLLLLYSKQYITMHV